MKTTWQNVWKSMAVAAVVCGVAADLPAATATNTQGAGTTGYWTNNAVWNNTPFPGSASGESAYLIGNVTGGYTNILDYTLPYAIGTLTLSNAGGEAWLIVTNAALTNTTLNVRNGGRLQIGNGGWVTNTTALSMASQGGRIYVSGGGTWYAGAATIGNGASNNLVSIGGGTVATALWNLRAGALTIGSGGATGNVVRVDMGGGGDQPEHGDRGHRGGGGAQRADGDQRRAVLFDGGRRDRGLVLLEQFHRCGRE
jgi:hypothetical protein